MQSTSPPVAADAASDEQAVIDSLGQHARDAVEQMIHAWELAMQLNGLAGAAEGGMEAAAEGGNGLATGLGLQRAPSGAARRQ